MNKQLIEKLYQARLAQGSIKERLQTQHRELTQKKANAYLKSFNAKGGTHFKALNEATTDPSVMKLQAGYDAIQIEHYRAWAESRMLADLLRDSIGKDEPEPIEEPPEDYQTV